MALKLHRYCGFSRRWAWKETIVVWEGGVYRLPSFLSFMRDKQDYVQSRDKRVNILCEVNALTFYVRSTRLHSIWEIDAYILREINAFTFYATSTNSFFLRLNADQRSDFFSFLAIVVGLAGLRRPEASLTSKLRPILTSFRLNSR